MHFTTLYNIRGVSIITSMVEYDFFPYTDVFVSYIHLIEKFVADGRNFQEILKC